MLLSEQQKDALIKFISIAFDHSTISLSELVGVPLHLDSPEVYLHPVCSLATHFSDFANDDLTIVSQIFKGCISGNVLWLLNYNNAAKLMDLFRDYHKLNQENNYLHIYYEMFTEFGNILLNACMGMFNKILDLQVYFSMPILHLQKLNTLLDFLNSKNELRYAIIIRTTLYLYENSVNSYILLVVGVPSLYQLIKAIETWAELLMPNQPAQTVSLNP
ncbi:MAG: chemotaxis protein CheC [Oscillatoriaceae bacterium SKW80]|nr:chemotaxis protein CheC [Oscillatoriaceae bacterium SKYG93]MCX8120012.1 chemotaxis protein CheC [Oscillatoriaceae bacterium SKW80]MDW8454015.1 chemotaxis protein CheC [Oscillatoriaceae cyanobacterium SKYGB_i_bin93]HIK29676.1 chemotaxis protein CheC [Oscillatoriaceae cyanobacterium M7585_C2015_266]